MKAWNCRTPSSIPPNKAFISSDLIGVSSGGRRAEDSENIVR